ncbi:MAG TPA: hypothetical protein VHY84_02410 [Bryobacteraceae bacterium]|jgi:hypothetical protein|nr:hypothetical protein [Bryobacteraceae bacterium]
MCACGCLVLVAVVAALVYCAMHGLWLIGAAVLLFAALIGWLGKKAAGPRNPRT